MTASHALNLEVQHLGSLVTLLTQALIFCVRIVFIGKQENTLVANLDGTGVTRS